MPKYGALSPVTSCFTVTTQSYSHAFDTAFLSTDIVLAYISKASHD